MYGKQDGDVNEYLTVETKRVYIIYFYFLGNLKMYTDLTFQISAEVKLRILF
jgi:hypothetical protein